MILIQFLTAPGCNECEKAKIILNEIKSLYPKVEVKEIDVMSLKGLTLATEHGIMSNPGIIINGELFSTGILNKEKLFKKIKSLESEN